MLNFVKVDVDGSQADLEADLGNPIHNTTGYILLEESINEYCHEINREC